MTAPPIDPAQVRERLIALQQRIDGIERRWDHPVEIMAVTKGFGPDAVSAAVEAGAVTVGENYAQELLSKEQRLGELRASFGRPDVAFIGRLQSNKVRLVAHLVDVWATIDRSSLVKELAKRAPGARILVQVNATGEDQKGGCPPDQVPELVDAARRAGLDVRGLMTVGPTGSPPEAAAPAFALVRGLVDDLALTDCSMGMSADLEIAVAHGSTQVRVGTALFGPRP